MAEENKENMDDEMDAQPRLGVTFASLVNRSQTSQSQRSAYSIENEQKYNGQQRKSVFDQSDIEDDDNDDVNRETDDADWDTDLEIDEPKARYDHSGRSTYIEACRRNNVVPASFFLRNMNEHKLRMKHHGFGASGIKPICVSMVGNTKVVHLNLTDNWLGVEGGNHVAEMLRENCYLQSVDLSDNRLGVEFVTKLPEVLSTNTTLTRIVLSGNELDDSAAPAIAEAILTTQHLETLILSHNKFGIGAGKAFGPAIAENVSLKTLDLSWNHIRRAGAVELAKGIKNNVVLHKINLSWNGFGLDGVKGIADALKTNSVLEYIDLSNNRITAEAAVLLAKSLTVNESLHTLMLGQNPMQSAGCYAICAGMLKNPISKLHFVDFTDILVNSDYKDIAQQCLDQFPNLKLKTGGDVPPPKPKAKLHPMIKLRNFITKNNLRLQDVFAQWDKDNSMSVTHDEFKEGIDELGLKLSDEEMNEILLELDEDGDGEINYCELVIGHADFAQKEQKMNDVISTLKSMVRD